MNIYLGSKFKLKLNPIELDEKISSKDLIDLILRVDLKFPVSKHVFENFLLDPNNNYNDVIVLEFDETKIDRTFEYLIISILRQFKMYFDTESANIFLNDSII